MSLLGSLGLSSSLGFSEGHSDLLVRSLLFLVALSSSEYCVFLHHLPLSSLIEIVVREAVELSHSAQGDSSRSLDQLSSFALSLLLLASEE